MRSTVWKIVFTVALRLISVLTARQSALNAEDKDETDCITRSYIVADSRYAGAGGYGFWLTVPPCGLGSGRFYGPR
jgi:hypothetical protein